MNTVKEIFLCLKNEPGQLSTVSELLGSSGIKIVAFYATNDESQGGIRFISNDPEKALNILKTSGYETNEKEVIACETPRHPGALNALLKPLKSANINIEYIYPCMGTGDNTVLILGVDPVQEVLKILEDNWIRTLGDELYST